MKPRHITTLGTSLCLSLAPIAGANPVNGWATTRVKERLHESRALFVHHKGAEGAYISWRLLESDPPNIGFNIYRKVGTTTTKLNGPPHVATTDWVDTNAPLTGDVTYFIKTVTGGAEDNKSKEITVNANSSLSYTSITTGRFGKVGIGDLDGDGEYDFVVRTPAGSTDPDAWGPSTATYKLKAFKSDGTHLWTYDFGWNIEHGIWYSPFIVYDFDGDGTAEVAAKVSKTYGSKPTSPVLGNYNTETKKYDEDEFLGIIKGVNGVGTVVHTFAWPNREGFNKDYNLYSRNQLGLAFLDGKTPCIIAARGTYGLMKATAYQFHNGELSQLWEWESSDEADYSTGKYQKQGSHSMHCVDVDGDGRDEIVLGAAVLDDDGTGLWALQGNTWDHPDHTYVGDLVPSRPGLEIYMAFEDHNKAEGGAIMVEAATGEPIWQTPQYVSHIHDRGLVSDIDPNFPGAEAYGMEETLEHYYYHNAQGEAMSHNGLFWDGRNSYGAAYWDADLQREAIVRNMIQKVPHNRVTRKYAQGFASSNSINDYKAEATSGSPILSHHDEYFEALKVKYTSSGTVTASYKSSAEDITVTPGKRYRLTVAYVTSPGRPVTAKLIGNTNTDLLGGLVLNVPGGDTVTTTFVVPSGVTSVVPKFSATGSGTFMVDDIVLLEDDNPAGRGVGTISGQEEIAWADVFGDWREEIITHYDGTLRIYSTTVPAVDRRPTLMQDPLYRSDVAHVAMGYAQVPMTSFSLDPNQGAGGATVYSVEAEDVVTVSSSKLVNNFTDSLAGGGEAEKLEATTTGDHVTYKLLNVPSGTYKVVVGGKIHKTRGRFQLKIDGAPHGGVVDQYTPNENPPNNGFVDFDLGSKHFTSTGDKLFKFEVNGKNPNSEGHNITIDYIRLVDNDIYSDTPYVWEAENLEVIGKNPTNGHSTFTETAASAGVATKLAATSNQHYVTYKVQGVPAGTYKVLVRCKRHHQRGIFQLLVNGSPQGPPMDQFIDDHEPDSLKWMTYDLGGITLSAGDHDFRFNAVKKRSTSGSYALTFDYVALLPVYDPDSSGDRLFEAESLAATSSVALTSHTDSAADGGAFVKLPGTGTNDYVTFTLPNVEAGEYRIVVTGRGHDTRGKYQLLIDNVAHGSVADQYNTSNEYIDHDFGVKNFTSTGNRSITLDVVGKHSSSKGHTLTVDSIRLEAQ